MRGVKFADPKLQAGFTQIPNVILRNASLSAGARLTYAMLASFAWDKDECFAGQKKLGELVGVGDRMIRNYLDELVTGGLLEVQRQGLRKPNRYLLFGSTQEGNCGSALDGKHSSDEEDPGEEDKPPVSPPASKGNGGDPQVGQFVQSIHRCYVSTFGKKGKAAELRPDERKIIRDALVAGDVAEIETCIRACSRSDFHMKRGEYSTRKGQRYDSLGKILKPRPAKGETQRSRIDFWLERETGGNGRRVNVTAEADRIAAAQGIA